MGAFLTLVACGALAQWAPVETSSSGEETGVGFWSEENGSENVDGAQLQCADTPQKTGKDLFEVMCVPYTEDTYSLWGLPIVRGCRSQALHVVVYSANPVYTLSGRLVQRTQV